jgi:predicted nucleic acid-binding protein
MLYLDSCVLIYWLEGAAPLNSRVAQAMRAAAGEVFCISDLVRLECLVGPIREGHAERRAAFEAQFRRLRRLALTRAVFDLGAELRAAHRLRTPDAIHAACAIVHGCAQFWTNDRRLAVLENRLGTRVVP